VDPRTRHRLRSFAVAGLGAAVAFGGGFALARRVAAPAEAAGHDTRAREDAESEDAAPSPIVRLQSGGSGAPSWAPTARGTLPSVGSMFRNRYATAESPLDGIEAVLLSPRATERLDDCPLALRVVRGEAGARGGVAIAESLGPNLLALADAPGIPPRLADWIRDGAVMFRGHASRSAEEEARQPLRVLFIGMPRPDVAPATWSVGLAVYDVNDVHFDATEPLAEARAAGRILVSRVETQAADGGTRLVAGALEIAPVRVPRLRRALPPIRSDLGAVFGSLWGHFRDLPEELGGLYLAPDGTVQAFDRDLRLHPLPQSPALKKALRLVLQRA